MAKKRWHMCCLSNDDIVIEKHTKNSITGSERTTKRSSTRSFVPIIDAITRIILTIGLVVAGMILASNMKPESLKNFENPDTEYVRKMNEQKLKIITYFDEIHKCLTNITNDLAQVRICLEVNARVQEGAEKDYLKCCWCPCCLWRGEGK